MTGPAALDPDDRIAYQAPLAAGLAALGLAGHFDIPRLAAAISLERSGPDLDWLDYRLGSLDDRLANGGQDKNRLDFVSLLSILLGRDLAGPTDLEATRRAAAHEAGHALVDRSFFGPDALAEILLSRDPQPHGSVQLRPQFRGLPLNFGSFLAGRAAEEIMFGAAQPRCASDMAVARSFVLDALNAAQLGLALSPALSPAQLDQLLPTALGLALRQSEGEALAAVRALLARQRLALESLTARLIEERELIDEYLESALADLPVVEPGANELVACTPGTAAAHLDEQLARLFG